MKTCPYRPFGTRVVVKILPVKSESLLVLPDGKTNLMVPQTYEVVAIGGAVNDATFSLKVGEIVLISCHESEVYPLNKEEKWIIVDRSKLVAAEENQTQN